MGRAWFSIILSERQSQEIKLEELQPNSRHCFVCGLENPFGLHLRFYQTGPGQVATKYTVPDHFQGYPGVVHGGIVAAMLDEVVGRAIMGPDPAAPRFKYTARLTVRYRKNVPTGKPLRVIGQIEQDRGLRTTARGKILDAEGQVLAEAEGLLVDVPEDVVDSTDLESLGWRVYPEESA